MSASSTTPDRQRVQRGERTFGAIFDPLTGFVDVFNSGGNNVSLIDTWFPVTFTERGLPNGTAWWVNVTGGPSTHSNSTTLSARLSPGAHSYTVATTNRTFAAPVGSVILDGSVATVNITFAAVTPVTFRAAGLPNPTVWQVTVDGTTRSTSSGSISLPESNGTYDYTLGQVAGWTTANFTGSFLVARGPVPMVENWTQVSYPVIFTETGSPSGEAWSVNVTGNLPASTNAVALTLNESNATYSYSVSSASRTYTPPGGTFDIHGLGVEESVIFVLLTYPVTFTEVGLRSGTLWSVALNGSLSATTATAITFVEPNGTYPFSLDGVTGYSASPLTGNVTVSGGVATQTVLFANFPAETFTVTFAERGLPTDLSWTATFNGLSRSGTRTIAFTGAPNKSYPFNILAPTGYSASPSMGAVEVLGANVTKTIAFAPTSSSSATFLGLPATEGYAVIGGIGGAIVAVGLIVVFWTRRRL